jgi:glycosyltransferase involved in cell wall biosynthesis
MDYLVANTRDIAGYISGRGWPEERVLYIPNFAEAPAADFRSARASLRARHGLPDDAFVLLAAGRLHENKGFDLLLSALGQLPGNVYLLLAGEGPLEKVLRSAAERAGVTSRVRFLGWIRPLSPLCAAADLWVVPSRHEPLGNVVLDAWMHGLPVVAARAKGPVSLIEDGETGVLVEVENAARLAGAIEALMADAGRRRDMARRGEARALAEFSADKVIARYLEFYRDAQRRRRNRA